MPKRKVSKRILKDFIKDEKKGSKTYRHYGFKRQAKDEHHHAQYFKKKYKKLLRKHK
jgi:hypothetical protein